MRRSVRTFTELKDLADKNELVDLGELLVAVEYEPTNAEEAQDIYKGLLHSGSADIELYYILDKWLSFLTDLDDIASVLQWVSTSKPLMQEVVCRKMNDVATSALRKVKNIEDANFILRKILLLKGYPAKMSALRKVAELS